MWNKTIACVSYKTMPNILLDTQLKIDQRSVKTQNKLFETLFKYYQSDYAFDDLTVSQLCQMAKIGRTTFYRHHQDVTDILTVEFLILINDFHQHVDRLDVLNYKNGSEILVTIFNQYSQLFLLIPWSHAFNRLLPVLVGELLRIFELRGVHISNQNILAQLLAANLLNFGINQAKHPELSLADQQQLFKNVIPDLV